MNDHRPMTSLDRLKRAVKTWLCGPEIVPALDTLVAHGVQTVTIDGDLGLVEFPAADRSILTAYAITKTWARPTVDLIGRAVVRHGLREGTFLDIGANVGLVSLAVCRETTLAVEAFEPDPTLSELFVRNVARQGFSHRVRCHTVALGVDEGPVELECSPTNRGDNRMRRASTIALQREHTWQRVRADGRRLDRVDVAPPVVVAKVDVQGAEPLVFAGGADVLASCALLLVEFSPYHMQRMGTTCRDLFPLMDAFDEFTVFEGDTAIEILKTSDRQACRQFLEQHDRDHARQVYGGYLDLAWEKTPRRVTAS